MDSLNTIHIAPIKADASTWRIYIRYIEKYAFLEGSCLVCVANVGCLDSR